MKQMARLAAVIGAVTLLSTGAFAMGPDGGEHPGHQGCGCDQHHAGHEGMRHDCKKLPWMLQQRLGLTGKQAGEISDIMEAEHGKAKPLFEALHKERKALMDAARSGDQAAVRSQAGKLADAEAALAVHHAAAHKRVAGVMTKEQAAKFEKMAEEFGMQGRSPCRHEQEHHGMSTHPRSHDEGKSY